MAGEDVLRLTPCLFAKDALLPVMNDIPAFQTE
jgi:hypothetical protein